MQTILFFHGSGELYGSDRTLLQLVEGLDRSRWRAVVALPREGPLADAVRACGATVEIGAVGACGRATLRPSGCVRAAAELWRAVRRARALVRAHAPAIVHSNTIVVVSGALAARRERVPHVWHVHEIFAHPRWVARALARLVARLSDRIVCNSRATADNLLAFAPHAREALRVIENGIAPFAARPETTDRASARRALGVDPSGPWIALVGRINAIKGQELLLRACARLRDRHPALRVLFAGDAPPGQPKFAAALERAIDAHGLRDRVVRLPFRADVDVVYAACDVLAVPSLTPESFGLVAVEAMALERPVVAARHGGIQDIVVDGETGLLFTPGDADELARALDELLSNPLAIARFGRAGQRRQRERFTVERYCAAFDALYAELAPRTASLTRARERKDAA